MKDLVVFFSVGKTPQPLSWESAAGKDTVKAAVCSPSLSNMRLLDSEKAIQSLHRAAENHPNNLLLEAEKYFKDRHTPEASL